MNHPTDNESGMAYCHQNAKSPPKKPPSIPKEQKIFEKNFFL